MNSKSRRLFSSGPSLPGGADSQRPAAVKGAGEPRRSEPLTARTAGKESRREGRATEMVKEFRDTEHSAERFFQSGIQAKLSTEQLRPKIPKLTAGELETLMRRLNLAHDALLDRLLAFPGRDGEEPQHGQDRDQQQHAPDRPDHATQDVVAAERSADPTQRIGAPDDQADQAEDQDENGDVRKELELWPQGWTERHHQRLAAVAVQRTAQHGRGVHTDQHPDLAHDPALQAPADDACPQDGEQHVERLQPLQGVHGSAFL